MIVRNFLTAGLLGIAVWTGIAVACKTEPVHAETLYTNPDTGYEAVIEDEADLLSDSEEADLADILMKVTEYSNAAFVAIDENPYYNTQRYAEGYSDDTFGGSSAVVFVVDMDNRYLYLDSTGAARGRITSSYADTITDNVYRYASDGDYYSCAYETFDQVYTLMRGEKIAQPMKYISNVLLAVAIAMLINFFAVIAFSKKRKASAKELISGIYSKYKVTDTRAAFVNQTKTYSPQSSGSGGSSGGSSGGGGGGGGHSGGGHSF